MRYGIPDKNIWTGRQSSDKAYFHEAVKCLPLDAISNSVDKKCALLGYACDEGVKRNLGRTGAKHGPGEIRKWLAKQSNHPGLYSEIVDFGDINCEDGDLHKTQIELATAISELLSANFFPVVMGGGHDIAYGHYNGIRKFVQNDSIGIINFDAHFDLRKFEGQSTSGTPFYQIANDCSHNKKEFHYMCLGVQPLSNIPELFKTADEYGVEYINRSEFNLSNFQQVQSRISAFIAKVDHLYITIDLDGFAASIAPGVSAPSPFGYDVELVLKVLRFLIESGKIISMDIAELNPKFDIDGHTARLAAYLIGYVLQY